MMKKLNIGLNYCKGKYIARMDADDLSLPNRFKLQLEVFNRKPDLAVAGSMAEAFDSNGHKVRASYFPTNYEAIRFTSMGKSPLIHVWTMIRKDYLEEFNGYNESFLIAADYDLWSRFLIKGYKIVVLKQKCVKCHRSNLTYSARNILIKNDEKPLIAKRNICFDIIRRKGVINKLPVSIIIVAFFLLKTKAAFVGIIISFAVLLAMLLFSKSQSIIQKFRYLFKPILLLAILGIVFVLIYPSSINTGMNFYRTFISSFDYSRIHRRQNIENP